MGFYDTAAWSVARRRALHVAGHHCQRCGTSLIGLGKAAHVHHRKRLKRAPAMGLELLKLVSLCRDCHALTHIEERRQPGADLDGRPMSPDHPWNAMTSSKSK